MIDGRTWDDPRVRAGRARTGLFAAALLACCCALPAGCAALKLPAPLRGDFGRAKQQRAEQAVREFEQHRDFAEYQTALHHWESGDEKGCREQIGKLLQRNPDHCPARLLLAEVYLAQQCEAEALEQVQHVLATEPQNAEAHHLMALVLDAQGRFAEALEHYRRAAELEPTRDLYRLGYVLAAQYADHGPEAPDGTSARAPRGTAPGRCDTQPAATVVPAGFTASADRAEGPQLAETGGQSPGVACAGSAGRDAWMDPATGGPPCVSTGGFARPSFDGPAAGLFEQARAALQTGRTAEAEAYLREAESFDPHNPQIPLAAGVLALSYGRPELGVRILTGAKQRFPDSSALDCQLAVACYRLGDYGGARAALEHALSLDNSSALSYFLLGCTLAKLGEQQSAEDCFRQARRIDPQYAARL